MQEKPVSDIGTESIPGASPDEKITEMIISRLKNGGKLPSEKQLVSQLGVSRTLLREILSSYESAGLITTQQGSGRFVNMPNVGNQIVDAWSIALRVDPSMLLDLLEIRAMLEINSFPRAMELSTVAQMRTLKNLVDIMTEKAAREESFVQEDREFHQTLLCSTGNALLEQLLSAFWDLFDKSQVEKQHGNMAEIAQWHQMILDAFIKKDLEAMFKTAKDMFADMRYWITLSLIKE